MLNQQKNMLAGTKLFHSNATISHRYSSIAPVQDNTGSMMVNHEKRLLHYEFLSRKYWAPRNTHPWSLAYQHNCLIMMTSIA
jgi:hypothetical protein